MNSRIIKDSNSTHRNVPDFIRKRSDDIGQQDPIITVVDIRSTRLDQITDTEAYESTPWKLLKPIIISKSPEGSDAIVHVASAN